MFSAFSFAPTTPFDLPAALKAWTTTNTEHSVPEFKGRPKRKDDLAPDAWLALVEKGSSVRSVPKSHWPAVAKHFMGKKARSRVLEVEKVMRALHGEQWDWRWKDFKVAVMNMGWNIEETKTRQVQVERKASGLWWIPGGAKEDTAQPTPTSKNTTKAAPSPKKALTDVKPSNEASSSKSSVSKVLNKSPPPKTAVIHREPAPAAVRRGSLFSLPALPFLRTTPQPQQTVLQTITAQVPLWLLAATEALATLSNEHPDVLTAVATALVAVGTVSAGGTAAVAAIGEAAVVVGRALKTAHDRTHSSSR
ncbi:hypothetical protein C8Q79DRAFT_1107013 [Trametes meyenii]|nr:hypothetical protein C8Q79DRAFT_1107013 [Trametes meyenii]